MLLLSIHTYKQKGIEPSALAAVMHSDQWRAHITNEDKIYYVNTQSQGIPLVMHRLLRCMYSNVIISNA